MPRRECPSHDQLLAFTLGDLDERAVEEVAAHLEGCSSCEEVLQVLDQQSDAVIQSLRGSTVAAPDGASTAVVPLPRQVGDYELLGELGRGGMGVVYRARHLHLHRVVALKMLLAGEFVQEASRARFRAEAEAVARLQHPHIVQIFDIGEWQAGDLRPSVPYFTLEYIDGGNLFKRLAGKPQAPQQAASWVSTLARAVYYAHGQGIVHRDIKPSNVLVTADGELKLCDFGVAKLLTGSDLKTQSGLLVGTPEYMAPEQAAGQAKALGPATDVYALGAMLYEMLTGRPPFQGATPLQTMSQVWNQEPVPPTRLQPTTPHDLETICLKCLRKAPDQRYGSALALAEDLERFLDGQPIRARPVGWTERSWKWARRRPALAALVALAVFTTCVGFPGTLWLWRRAESAREQAEREHQRADRERERAETSLYASHIALADHAVQNNDIASALLLLDRYLPTPEQPGRADLRGWEWHYLKQLCQTDLVPGLSHEEGDWNWVHAVTFSPDSQRLLTSAGLPGGNLPLRKEPARDTPGELKLWDPARGSCLATLTSHRGAVWAVAWSPAGQHFASGGADGSVTVWQAANPSTSPHDDLTVGGSVQSLVFSPNGRYLGVVSTQELLIWDVRQRRATGKHRMELRSPCLAFSGDSSRLFLASAGESVLRSWDVGAGEELKRLPLPHPVQCLAFSADGRFLATTLGTDHRIQVWDTAGPKLLHELFGHTNSVLRVAFSPKDLLASGSDDKTVRLWDLKTGRERAIYRGHTAGVLGLAFSPDGTRLASTSKDRSIKLWNAERDPRGLAIAVRPGQGEFVANLVFSPDSQALRVLHGSLESHALQSWDANSGALQTTRRLDVPRILEFPHPFYCVSSDGRRIAGLVPADTRAVVVWDVETAAKVATLHCHEVNPNVSTLSLDGQTIAFSGWAWNQAGKADALSAELLVGDAATGAERLRLALPAGKVVEALALSLQGRHLAAVVRPPRRQDGSSAHVPPEVILWDTTTGHELSRLAYQDENRILALAFSVDGKRLASASVAGFVDVWDMTTGLRCYPSLSGSGVLTGITFSPDGQRLVAAGIDGFVRIWDAATGNQLLVLAAFGAPATGHYGFRARVVFSPDGTRLAANSWDGTVSLWDIHEPRAKARATEPPTNP
jgi:WD40 repeat protein